MHPTTIISRNVNNVFSDVIWALSARFKESTAVVEQSRNGQVIRFDGPVILTYKNPTECVLLNEKRDANPFFHLMEAIWMLAGRSDAKFVSQFSSGIAKYADDGVFYGAYGDRWRHAFEMDQIVDIYHELNSNPTSRRVVLQMWDANHDLGGTMRDHPCNTHAYFQISRVQLNMTVCNRSNDIVWGACGANAVHFPFLQQFLAESLGVQVGAYHQISNNMHLYTGTHGEYLLHPELANPVAGSESLIVWPIYDKRFGIGENLYFAEQFCMNPDNPDLPTFYTLIARPMYNYYMGRKASAPDKQLLIDMPECNWKRAALDWVHRREKNV